MKKLYTILTAVALSFATFSNAVDLTFRLDMTAFMAGGGTISPDGIHVAGDFGAAGATSPASWSPGDAGGMLTSVGGNMYEVTIMGLTAGATLPYKFVNGNDWGTAMNIEGQTGTSIDATCGIDDGNGGFNRSLVVPDVNATVMMMWNSCAIVSPNGINDHAVNTVLNLFPNPANEATTISYDLATSAKVSIEIYNAVGQRVNSTEVSQKNPGSYRQTLNVANLSNGIYFVKLNTGKTSSTSRISVSR